MLESQMTKGLLRGKSLHHQLDLMGSEAESEINVIISNYPVYLIMSFVFVSHAQSPKSDNNCKR